MKLIFPGSSEPEVPEVKEEPRQMKLTFPKADNNFDIISTPGNSSVLNQPTNIVQSEDSTTTRPKLDKTDTERGQYVKNYLEYYKKNMVNNDGTIDYTGRDFDREALIQAGIDTRTIDMVEDSLRKNTLIPEAGLESDVVLPITAEYSLANKLAEPIMKKFGEAGAYLMRSWATRGIPRRMVKAVEAGDEEAIAEYLKTVENLKGLGFGDEMLKGGKVSSNVFEQQKYADEVLSKAKGKFRKLLNKEAPYNAELPTQYSEIVTSLKKSMDADSNAAYKAMDNSASDFTYNIKGLREEINSKLTAADFGIPENAYNKVMKIIDYQKRTLSPEQKGAMNNVKELTTQIENISSKLAIADPKKKGTLTNQLNSLKKQRDKYKELVPDTDYVKEQDFVNMIQRINANTTGSHMGLSTHDKDVLRGLRASKSIVDKYFEKVTKEHNPAMYEQFKSAQGKSAETFKKFGTESKRTELGKILDTDDSTAVFNNIMENPYKVGEVGRQLDELQPGMGKQFAESWIQRKLGSVREGTGKIMGGKNIDYSSLNSSLDEMVNNPESAEMITRLLGKEKLTQLRSLKAITGSLEETVKSLGIEGPLEDGIRAYIKSGKGTGKIGRALEVAFDKTRQIAGQAYDTLPDVLKANKMLQKIPVAGEYVPDISKTISGRFDKEEFAMKRLIDLIKKTGETKDPALRDFFEQKLGGVTAEIANEEGIIGEDTIPIVNSMIAAGLAPGIIYKTIGVAGGTAAYDTLSRYVEKKMASKEEQAVEEDTTNIFDVFKRLFK